MSKHVTKKAKVLEDFQVRKLRNWITDNSHTPERDDLMFLLSYHAGLRASEISKLDVDAMTDTEGNPLHKIFVDSKVGKRGRGREVPMTPYLTDALLKFRRRYPDATYVAISRYRGGARMSADAVKVYMREIYLKAGFLGASSHSGRRTYITNLARRINNFGGSLRDVQLMAGHARIDTTENYVEANPAVFAAAASLAA
jgi:integrase/recombinase XerD